MWRLVAIVLVFLLPGCTPKQSGGGTTLVETPAVDDKVSLPPAPSVPVTFVIDDDTWMPAVKGGTQSARLAQALEGKSKVMALLGPTMDNPADEARLGRMLAAINPNLRMVARGKTILDSLLVERGLLPYRTTLEPGGLDMLGRPFFLPKEHVLKTDWIDNKKALKGAQVILVADYVTVDESMIRQMRQTVVGGCDQLIDQFNAAKAAVEEQLSPLAEALNRGLRLGFVRRVAKLVDRFEAAASDELLPAQARCRAAAAKLMASLGRCSGAVCEAAPRFVSAKGGVVVMDLLSGAVIPPECPVDGGVDWAKEILLVGQEATVAVVGQIDSGWMEDLRLADGLVEISETITEQCGPSNRRFEQLTISALHRSLAELLSVLVSSDNNTGGMELADGQAFVAGRGPMWVVAGPSREGAMWTKKLAAFRQQLGAAGLCRDSKQRPVQVSVIDVETSEVLFNGIDFEEQFFCQDLAPGTAPNYLIATDASTKSAL